MEIWTCKNSKVHFMVEPIWHVKQYQIKPFTTYVIYKPVFDSPIYPKGRKVENLDITWVIELSEGMIYFV